MSAMLEHALDYAARGWPVFPVHGITNDRCTCRHSGCDSPGKHPRTRQGLHDASVDPAVISRWWMQWPTANIGVRTGIAFDVLDLDGEDPLEVTAGWPAVDWPGGPVVRTARGWHFYCLPTGVTTRTRVGGAPLADWRGDGGYVVAPPSMHVSGRRYEWWTPAGLELHAAPAEVIALLTPPAPPVVDHRVVSRTTSPRGGGWNPSGLVDTVRRAPVGTRNAALNWAAHQLGRDRAAGKCTEGQALEVLAEMYDAAIGIGLGEREVAATVRSGYTSGAGKQVAA